MTSTRKLPSRTAKRAFTNQEIKAIGDKYLSKFDYLDQSLHGYMTRFKDTSLNKFFSVKQSGSMLKARRNAKNYRDELLRSGQVETRRADKGGQTSLALRPLVMSGDPRIEALMNAFDLLDGADVELLSQARILHDVAFDDGATSNSIRANKGPEAVNLKLNVMLMTRKTKPEGGRTAYGLFNRVKVPVGRAYEYTLSSKGKRLIHKLMETLGDAHDNPDSIVTYQNDPRLAGLYSAIVSAIEMGLLTTWQLSIFLRAALYEGSSVAAITGKSSNHPEAQSFRANLYNLGKPLRDKSGNPGMELVAIDVERCEDNLTKEIRLTPKGRRFVKKLLKKVRPI
jgi:predicted transcriptional regulator